jgi:hypothetical protein
MNYSSTILPFNAIYPEILIQLQNKKLQKILFSLTPFCSTDLFSLLFTILFARGTQISASQQILPQSSFS